MLTRLWFALSVLWMALMFLLMLNPNANDGGRVGLALFGVAPLVCGMALKILGRYIVTGRVR